MRKKYNEHVLKCNLARKGNRSQLNEDEAVRPIVEQILLRLKQLEDENARLRCDVRSLQEAARVPAIRGTYEMRHDDTPTHGFGDWSTEFFLEHLKETDRFYRETVGHSIIRRNVCEFISAVFYVANGNTHIVRIGENTRTDRHGYPLTVDLNFKRRRRSCTWDAAINRFFKRSFLPTVNEVQECLGMELPETIRQGLSFHAHYMKMKPSKKHKDMGSYASKCELLLAIANYRVPERERKRSPEEKADEYYATELETEGRFWVQPRQWSMERIVQTYDCFLGKSQNYKTDLSDYFRERPERLKEYHDAGGTLV